MLAYYAGRYKISRALSSLGVRFTISGFFKERIRREEVYRVYGVF